MSFWDYDKWALIAWGVWIFAFFALEFWFMFDKNPNTPPLTDVITSGPGWLIFLATGGLYGWLTWHWFKTYESKGN